tara:strand:- start:676 stop:993 length:318 start_codon:yes stop_codon:yes gene_type:complete
MGRYGEDTACIDYVVEDGSLTAVPSKREAETVPGAPAIQDFAAYSTPVPGEFGDYYDELRGASAVARTPVPDNSSRNSGIVDDEPSYTFIDTSEIGEVTVTDTRD